MTIVCLDIVWTGLAFTKSLEWKHKTGVDSGIASPQVRKERRRLTDKEDSARNTSSLICRLCIDLIWKLLFCQACCCGYSIDWTRIHGSLGVKRPGASGVSSLDRSLVWSILSKAGSVNVGSLRNVT